MSDANTILVVDDDEDIRALVAAILAWAGHTTKTAEGGLSALASAQQDAPEVVVLDMRMPDMSGLDVCRTLKADRATAGTRVLLISAESSPADIAAAYAAGCDDYLPKPFSTRDLIRHVDQLLSSQPGLESDAAPSHGGEDTT